MRPYKPIWAHGGSHGPLWDKGPASGWSSILHKSYTCNNHQFMPQYGSKHMYRGNRGQSCQHVLLGFVGPVCSALLGPLNHGSCESNQRLAQTSRCTLGLVIVHRSSMWACLNSDLGHLKPCTSSNRVCLKNKHPRDQNSPS